MKALMALTLLSLASCGDSSEEGKAKDAAAESAPAQEAHPAASPDESAAPEHAADGDTAASAAENAAKENAAKENAATANATGTLPPAFAQDGALDASRSASEDVAPVIPDDFLVPEADPERDLEGLGDSPDAPATPDVPAALP